jgi:hypothetical protein
MVTQNEPSCLKTNTAGKKTALGRTYERQSKRQGQNSNRVVITICNLAFDSPANDKVPASLSDALVTDQLSQLAGTSVTQFSGMVSSTILHEFAHAVSVVNKKFEVLDLPDKEHAYGWDNIFLNNAADAVKNADNYTFLGIWAGLAEMGFTLVRIKGTEEAIVKEALEGYTEAGRLYQYTDLTKRDLVMIARRFTA